MRVRAKKTEDQWNKGEEAMEELFSINTDEDEGKENRGLVE